MPGRVYKRSDIFWIAFSHKGKEYRRSAKTESKREAESVLSFYLGQCARGEFKGFEDTRLIYSFSEMLDDYLVDFEQRGMRSVKDQSYKITRIKAFFKDKAASDIDERQIDLFIKHRLKVVKPATINRELALILAAFNIAKRKKLVKEVPAIVMFPEHNARQGFFEREEFEHILTFLPDYLHDVMKFIYLTGWRKMEALTLQWRDIQGDVIRLRPEIAKNKDGRLIVMVGEIKEIIEHRRLLRLDLLPYVFHRRGKPIRCYDAAWDRARKQAGLETRFVHDMRRTAARNMDRAGVPRQVAKAIMGHKTDDMYYRYRIVNEDDIREGMEKAHAYLEAQKPKVLYFGRISDK